jgi:hypothetical protein
LYSSSTLAIGVSAASGRHAGDVESSEAKAQAEGHEGGTGFEEK